MHVLLTGASSFLGSHLAEQLLRTGLSVTATYRTFNNAIQRLRALGKRFDLRLIQIDLAEDLPLSRMPGSVDAVVHVAGVSTVADVSIGDMLACNVTGTYNVLRYALSAGASRLIYMSTLSIYGKISVTVVDENTPIIDPNIYGASKYIGERLLAAVPDLASVAVRLPGVLGRGAHRAWLPSILESIRMGEDVTIYNPDSPFNNAAHVDDLARFVGGLVKKRWQGFYAFPVGANGTITIRQAVERLIAATNRRITVTVRPVSQPSFMISSEYAMRSFGYEPMEIGAMLDHYVRASLRGEDRSRGISDEKF